MKLTRRSALAGAGAAGVLACGPRYELVGPFPLGVSSGEATHAGALLWTMYRGDRPLTVRVWREQSTAFEAPATRAPSGAVHVEAAGLAPFTWYSFEFSDGVERSPPGRFRTAPADGQAVPLTFGAVSCTKQNFPLDPLTHAAQRSDLDGFFVLGDTVYCDGAEDLAGFRAKWSEGLVHPAQRALRSSTSTLCVWDDHELFNNWDVEQLPVLPNDEFYAGLQAFYGHQPVSPGAGRQLGRSLKWGATAEVFVLDCRGERRPSTRHYISQEQMDWLKQGLSKSAAAFKVILNSVPISSFPGLFFEETADDRWQGYAKQREEILGFIDDQKVGGVLWVSGDFHLASMGRVSRAGPGSSAIEVLVGPGGQTPNASPSYPGPPQFDWSSGINNYATFSFDPATVRVDVKFFDGRGRVLTQKTYAL